MTIRSMTYVCNYTAMVSSISMDRLYKVTIIPSVLVKFGGNYIIKFRMVY